MSGHREVWANDWRLIRADVCHRYGNRCAYCSAPVGLREGNVDHYLPLALGGDHSAENLRWSCPPCNSAKGAMHPDAWEALKPAPKQEAAPRRVQLLQRIAQRQRPEGLR